MPYNPQKDAVVVSKPFGAVGFPIDSRSFFYDEANFVRRAFVSIAEVLAYFDTPFKREGMFYVFVNSTGTLQPDGTILGGERVAYWWKEGTADNQLIVVVEKGEKGDKGDTGSQGIQGFDGWEQLTAIEIVNVGGVDKTLRKLVDWFGGTGTKPTANIGKYEGIGGWVADPADAIDVISEASEVALALKADKTSIDNFYEPISFYERIQDPTKDVNILLIGDSNFDLPERLPKPILERVIKYRRSIGLGWITLTDQSPTMGQNNIVKTGTWVLTDIFGGGHGLDGRMYFSNTLNSTLTVSTNPSYINADLATFDRVRVYYQKGSAGVVSYSINGGSEVNQTLDTGSGTMGAFDVVFPSALSTNTLQLKLISGEVQLLGALVTNSTLRGIRVDKAAHSGAQSGNFNTLSTNAAWSEILTQIDPTVVIIQLGTNDFVNNTPSATYSANMDALVKRIKSLTPQAAIYLVAPPQVDTTIVTGGSDPKPYRDELLAVTIKNNVAFVPLYDILNKTDRAYTNTFYADGIHWNELGAKTISPIFTETLFPNDFFAGTRTTTSSFTNGRLARFMADGSLNASAIYDNGSEIDINGNANIIGNFSIKSSIIKESNFGYGSGYKVLLVGNTSGNHAIGLGYDPIANTSGNFNGDEIIVRNNGEFITPNAASDDFLRGILKFVNGNVLMSGKLSVAMAPTNPTDVVRKTELDLKANIDNPTFTTKITTPKVQLSSLNTAPSSSTDTGTLGEIRVTETGIFICTATNTWIKCIGATF